QSRRFAVQPVLRAHCRAAEIPAGRHVAVRAECEQLPAHQPLLVGAHQRALGLRQSNRGPARAHVRARGTARGESRGRRRRQPVSRDRGVPGLRLSRHGRGPEAVRADLGQRLRSGHRPAAHPGRGPAAAARIEAPGGSVRRPLRACLHRGQGRGVRDLRSGHQLLGAGTSAAESVAVPPWLRYKADTGQDKGKRLKFMVRRTAVLWLGAVLSLSACGGHKGASGEGAGAKVLNLYIWSDYLAANTLSDFEKQTGIKVNVAYFDTNETLETKLLAGSSGYDIVVPTASYFERQIKAGVYLPLDKSKLPNLKNMDPQLMAKVALHDPGNAHGIIYMWGTNGIGYNEKMIKALMPDAPLDSWRMVFDPAVASKVAKCGISVLDSPAEMMRAVYSYLGKDPNSQSPDDLVQAEAVLTKIRPYIRNINSSEYIEALANGDLCLAVGYNGDVMQARDRARDANKGVDIKYVVPKEGSILWFDMLAIPKDAPHPDSALAFMNYIMTPQVIADISNFKRYANGNLASQPLVLPAVKDDPEIYPPPEIRRKLAVQLADSADQTRAITRVWQKFKTGQ